MRRLTADDLSARLLRVQDSVRDQAAPDDSLKMLTELLLLKRVMDEPDAFGLDSFAFPGRSARFPEFGEAVRELQARVPDLRDALPLDADSWWTRREFEPFLPVMSIPLADQDLEFPDVVGRAYERFLEHRVSKAGAGRSGLIIRTPSSVSRLMARLVRPREGHSVFDPCTGSGSTLIQARQYVEEHGGDGDGVMLFGQEANRLTWKIARINLLLHGARNGSIAVGDVLADPRHLAADGRLMRFDRVLSAPPMSLTHADDAKDVHPERWKYGWLPGRGKKADLMYVQHVLSVLEPDGMAAVVVPYGVLFRGGAEAAIRRGLCEDGRLDAVIGIGPNAYFGTSVPACILILRGEGDGNRRPVFFINAEHESPTGRTEYRLTPGAVEKICRAYDQREDISGFARVVDMNEIEHNDFDLHIRRYVYGSTPVERPLNARAALFGGVPRDEIASQSPRYRAFGIDPEALFLPVSPRYASFRHADPQEAAQHISGQAVVHERACLDAFQDWWKDTAAPLLTMFAGTSGLLTQRSGLLASFQAGPGRLTQDPDLMSSVFADWWDTHGDDLRCLGRWGFTATARRRLPLEEQARHVDEETDAARAEVLETLRDGLRSQLQKALAGQRQELMEAYELLWDRYGTSLADLEEQGARAAARLKARLEGLGFA
ncbi:N-6 DNA methylase [Streptomyces sp. NPDC006368]|uniref:N-6 DNA methylase n=1 Tax=Streptomyces sp. NPDC006368 TaxID=3156760 RepID=UPI0033AA4AA6